jgi:hypothetical protein
MAGTIRAQDFEVQSSYGGPGTFRDYRLRHLPTGLQWEQPGGPGLTTREKVRRLFAWANRDLISLGWEADEGWQRYIEELAG